MAPFVMVTDVEYIHIYLCAFNCCHNNVKYTERGMRSCCLSTHATSLISVPDPPHAVSTADRLLSLFDNLI